MLIKGKEKFLTTNFTVKLKFFFFSSSSSPLHLLFNCQDSGKVMYRPDKNWFIKITQTTLSFTYKYLYIGIRTRIILIFNLGLFPFLLTYFLFLPIPYSYQDFSTKNEKRKKKKLRFQLLYYRFPEINKIWICIQKNTYKCWEILKYILEVVSCTYWCCLFV